MASADSPFHVPSAWSLPLGSEGRLLLVDGDRAIASDIETLMSTKAASIHRINFIYKLPTDKGEYEEKSSARTKEEDELLQTLCTKFETCQCLTVLKIKGFPINKSRITELVNGVRSSKSLQHLALDVCSLGDPGCLAVCQALAYCPTVSSLSLQGNNLTSESASAIGALLGKQELVRSMVWWKRSLRNRSVNPETLLGLTRLTLNDNPRIGDNGLQNIIDALYDDFWMKAVDMQNCGLTDKGAAEIVKLLKINKEIHVFDLRNNESVSFYSLRSIMYRISKNIGPNVTEPVWLNNETKADKEDKKLPSERPLSSTAKQSNKEKLREKHLRRTKSTALPIQDSLGKQNRRRYTATCPVKIH